MRTNSLKAHPRVEPSHRGCVDATNAPVSNIVCGVSLGVTPRHIESLRAVVHNDGHITVDGRDVLAAATNGIRTILGKTILVQHFCNTSNATCGTASTASPTGVAIDPDGDFRIDDTLSPLPPTTCTNPVLLITEIPGKGGLWFAAAIPADNER